VLYSFQGGTDGSNSGTPVLDNAGNLYSFTNDGGSKGYGTIFQLSPQGGGQWKRTVLYSFPGGKPGATPGHMISDAAGNFYGTTGQGGDTSCSLGGGILGCGVVFKLSPNSHGGWAERVLYTFTSIVPDGILPGDLALDGQGNLYGTTAIGGPNADGGSVFKLTPKPTGSWTKTVLYNFGITVAGGLYPYAGVTFDNAGNLYGTTTEGGDPACGQSFRLLGCGVVYELTPTSSGFWRETILHVFEAGSDGFQPWDKLVFDKKGNLYGTTVLGGGSGCSNQGCGTVFQITAGKHAETIIHSFGNVADGVKPYSGLITDGVGNLFGTTYSGGIGAGTVFEISTH